MGEVAPTQAQRSVCARFGAVPVGTSDVMTVGIARSVRERLLPLNGLRHPPAGGTSGWFIWAGGELSSDPDFFLPLHVAHLTDWCPQVLRYLALPPGWRFLLAPGYEDVWFDQTLLDGIEPD